MSPDEGQEEYEEAQAEIKKKEDEVGPWKCGLIYSQGAGAILPPSWLSSTIRLVSSSFCHVHI